MKKKYLNITILWLIILIMVEIITNREIIFDTISFSLNTWVKNIVPSLFPFFILSDFLINYHIVDYIPNLIKKGLRKLFNISDYGIIIFFLSMISGFPSNARNTKNLYQLGLISKEEASHILTFTHFSNPLFILGTLAIFFLHNKTYGIIILLSHYLGNIILGILIRKNNFYNQDNYIKKKNISQSFGKIFSHSIKSSIDTLLMILGTLTCFLVISTVIINRLNLDAYTAMLTKGILEITMGLKSLCMLDIPDIYKVIISSMFLSFGGLSVHMQVITELEDTGISVKGYLKGRIIHAVISGILAYLFFMFL